MNKFWEWIEKKEYGCKINNHTYLESCENFTKQMLIGYMIEYLIEENNYPWGYISIPSSCVDDTTINNIFEIFEIQINKIN